MFENLFKFPVVMVDGNREEEKEREMQRLNLPSEQYEVDVIIGEAECPYYDFVSVTDRWLPTQESFQRAIQGKFDACSVLFSHSGTFVVPWPREKFKKALSKFSKKAASADDNATIKLFDREKLLQAIKEHTREEENDEPGDERED